MAGPWQKIKTWQAALGNRFSRRAGGRWAPFPVFNTRTMPLPAIVLDDISALQKEDSFRDIRKSICKTGKRVAYWAATASAGASS